MTTAAQKVFGIPELVEEILNAAIDEQHTPTGVRDEEYVLSRKNLFTLQRVNKMFQGIICGSIHIQRRMLLKYQQTTSAGLPYSVVELLRATGEFTDEPFVQTIWSRPVDHDIIPDIIRLSFDLENAGDNGISRIGIVGKANDYSDQSWRRMKLTFQPMPIRVTVFIAFRIISKRKKTCNCIFEPLASEGCYYEIRHFVNGKGTLGELVDFMTSINQKTPGQHCYRNAQERERYGDNVSDFEEYDRELVDKLKEIERSAAEDEPEEGIGAEADGNSENYSMISELFDGDDDIIDITDDEDDREESDHDSEDGIDGT